jgi:hypothetical protein
MMGFVLDTAAEANWDFVHEGFHNSIAFSESELGHTRGGHEAFGCWY